MVSQWNSSGISSQDSPHLQLCSKVQELQRYQERIEKLSQQDRVSKFCTDAGFLTTVEIGQYFMTKDTEEFSQFTDSVACREYILPRDENLSEPKGWIRGNTEIRPVLEVTTSYLQGKYGVEIIIDSVNKRQFSLVGQNFSWLEQVVHGLEQQRSRTRTSRKPQKCRSKNRYAFKLNARDCASRTRAKAKPQKRDSASSSTRTMPIGERTWTDIEPGKFSLTDCSVSKKLINLLRHGSLPREDDGAIEFWRLTESSLV